MLQIASAIKAFRTNRYAYCISGMELSLYAYLKGNPSPTREDIRKMLSGNLCAYVGKKQIEGAISNVLEIVPSQQTERIVRPIHVALANKK